MKKLLQYWKANQQWLTFLFMIIYLNGFFIILEEQMRTIYWLPIGWLVQFFGLAGWYSYVANKKGWKLPRDIKNTHS
jgi:hypothetical protein